MQMQHLTGLPKEKLLQPEFSRRDIGLYKASAENFIITSINSTATNISKYCNSLYDNKWETRIHEPFIQVSKSYNEIEQPLQLKSYNQ